MRGDRPDDSVVAEPREGVTDQLWLAVMRPLGGRRGRKPISAQRGAASVVGVGGESSTGDGHPD